MSSYIIGYIVASIVLTALCAVSDRLSGGQIFASSTYRYAAFMVFAVPFFLISALYICCWPIAWLLHAWIEWMVDPPEEPVKKQTIKITKEDLYDDARTRPN